MCKTKFEKPEEVDEKLAKKISGDVPERVNENLKKRNLKI